MAFNIEQWLEKNTANLRGRVVVMTGAAGGLGSCLSRYIVRLGAKLVMVDRDTERMSALKADLLKGYPEANIEMLTVDLNNLLAVDDLTLTLASRRIDYLVLNAGVYNVPLSTGQLGYNNVFQINFISQYYLVKKLLPTLARTQGKVVAVSSIAYKNVKLNEDDLDYTKNAKGTAVYGNSKRFLMFALSELFRRPDAVHLSLVHPGVTLTPMTNAKNKALINLTMRMIFPKPEVAALHILDGLYVDIPSDQWVGPKRKGIWGTPTVQKFASTDAERARIFELAENIFQVACMFVQSNQL